MKEYKFMKPIHLPHRVIVKAPGLLPMLYKPGELATELGIPARTLFDWLKTGVPHQRDERNHIWINGSEFIVWVTENQHQKEKQPKLNNNEGRCFKCKKAVIMDSILVMPIKGNLIQITGTCPLCSGKVTRGGRLNGQSN